MIASNPSHKLDQAQTTAKSKAHFALLTAGWAANFAVLLATVGWVYADGRAPASLDQLVNRLRAVEWSAIGWSNMRADQWIAWGGSLLAIASGIVVALGLIWGPSYWRGLRSWLLAMALACCWCGLFVLWPDLHWQGQQSRLSKALPQASTLVQRLAANWPQEDGSIDELGHFLAYPRRAPTTLLMMGQCHVPGTSMRFSVVEKTTDGAIRFGLVWPEPNTWLEWREDVLVPTSFVGGLMTQHELMRYQRLDANWFLVRYDEGITSHTEQL